MTHEQQALITALEALVGRALDPPMRRWCLTQAYHVGDLSAPPTHEGSFAVLHLASPSADGFAALDKRLTGREMSPEGLAALQEALDDTSHDEATTPPRPDVHPPSSAPEQTRRSFTTASPLEQIAALIPEQAIEQERRTRRMLRKASDPESRQRLNRRRIIAQGDLTLGQVRTALGFEGLLVASIGLCWPRADRRMPAAVQFGGAVSGLLTGSHEWTGCASTSSRLGK